MAFDWKSLIPVVAQANPQVSVLISLMGTASGPNADLGSLLSIITQVGQPASAAPALASAAPAAPVVGSRNPIIAQALADNQANRQAGVAAMARFEAMSLADLEGLDQVLSQTLSEVQARIARKRGEQAPAPSAS